METLASGQRQGIEAGGPGRVARRLSGVRPLVVVMILLWAAAVVLWVVSLAGSWELSPGPAYLPRSRSVWWGVGGSAALAGVVLARGRSGAKWQVVVGLLATAACATLAVLVWLRAGRQTWPEAASAIGYLALVAGALAAALGVVARAGAGRRSGPRPTGIVLAVVVAVGAGCGVTTIGWADRSLGGTNAHSPLPVGAAGGPPGRVAWQRDVSSPEIVTDDSQVYVADSGATTITAIDPTTGATRWTYRRPGGLLLASSTKGFLASDDQSVVAAFGARIVVLDARTGRQRLTLPTTEPGVTSPSYPVRYDQPTLGLVDGDIVVGDGYRTRAYSASDGHLLWVRSAAQVCADGSAASELSPTAVAAGPERFALGVHCGGADTAKVLLVATAAGGPADRLVTAPAPVPAPDFGDDLSDPPPPPCVVAAGGLIGGFDTGEARVIFGIDPTTATVTWVHRVALSTSPSCPLFGPAPRGVLTAVDSDTDAVLDPGSGAEIRAFPASTFYSLYDPVLSGKWAYVATEPAGLGAPVYLRTVDLDTGAVTIGTDPNNTYVKPVGDAAGSVILSDPTSRVGPLTGLR